MAEDDLLSGSIARIQNLRERLRGERARRLALVLASVVFLAGAVVAARRLELDVANTKWGLIGILIAAGVPLTVLGKALEYSLSATILDRKSTLRSAIRISVISSAANLLPIPGALLVRIQALHGLGASRREATASTASLALIWLGVSAFGSGLVLVLRDNPIGWPLGIAGVAVTAAGYALLRRKAVPDRRIRILVSAILIEAGLLIVATMRMWLAIEALGFNVDGNQVFVLTLSGVLASAVGIFPGGLGLREVLAAALASLVAIPPAVAYLATAIDRIGGAALHGLLAMLMIRWGGESNSVELGEVTASTEDTTDV